jgi:hypothetical protein
VSFLQGQPGLIGVLLHLARLLEVCGAVAYGGPLLAFAFLLPFANRIRNVEPWHVDRVYRAWGPGFGLGVTALFFGGVLAFWLERGGFRWDLSVAPDVLLLVSQVLFLALQVSYTVLEVWTNEPLRQLDGNDGVTQVDAYLAARRRVARHVALNACCFVVVVVLRVFAG